MAITGAVSTALRQDAPYQAEIAMGAQALLDFQGARSGRRPYYWYRGTRYTDPRKIPGFAYTCGSENIGENADGSLVRAAANDLCLTDQGVSLWEGRQNKVTIFNANPTNTTGISVLSGTATPSVEDDPALLAAAGLLGVASSGKVFRISASTSAVVTVSGTAGNTNTHILSVYARGTGGVRFYSNGAARGAVTVGAGYVRSFSSSYTAAAGSLFAFEMDAGAVVYFILPQLEEGAYATPVIETRGAAATRAAPSLAINGQAVILGQTRTNCAPNSGMVGAVAGTPGTLPTGWFWSAATPGLTTSVVGTGVEDGYPYVDLRLSGTATGPNSSDLSFMASVGISAIAGQEWTASHAVRLIAGSAAGMTTRALIFARDAGGASLNTTNGAATALTAAKSPDVVTATLSGASVANVSSKISISGFATGQTYDLTVRISIPQLERGGVATDPIITPGSPLTVGGAFSVFARANLPANDNTERYLVAISDGVNESASIRRSSANAARASVSGPVSVVGLSPAGTFDGARSLRLFGRFRNAALAVAANGSPIASTAVTMPAGLRTITVGTGGSNYLNGYLAELAIYGDLSDAQGQRLAS